MPMMLEPCVPVGSLMEAAILAIGFSEKTFVPELDIGLRKVAELLFNSATFRVLIRRLVCCHELLVASIEQLVKRVQTPQDGS